MVDKKLVQCQGADCPEILKQAGMITTIKGRVNLVIFLLIATLGFHTFTFMMLLKFMDEYNHTMVTEQQVFSRHIIEMVKLDGRVGNVEASCKERQRLFNLHVQVFDSHLEKYHDR